MFSISTDEPVASPVYKSVWLVYSKFGFLVELKSKARKEALKSTIINALRSI
jgi:hypothetical protein